MPQEIFLIQLSGKLKMRFFKDCVTNLSIQILIYLHQEVTSKFREFMSPAIIVHLKMTKFKLQKK